MPYQNRVHPNGNIFAVESRGTLLGNRGQLHSTDKTIKRQYQKEAWITCLLEWPGIRREIMGNGYTELFFLDEATAFSAGHRPCNDCRKKRAKEFKTIWRESNAAHYENPSDKFGDIDNILHAERIDNNNRKITFFSKFSNLPDGVFVEMDDVPFLKIKNKLLKWSFEGYVSVLPDFPGSEVKVLTPKSIVRCFENGFVPEVHHTALQLLD